MMVSRIALSDFRLTKSGSQPLFSSKGACWPNAENVIWLPRSRSKTSFFFSVKTPDVDRTERLSARIRAARCGRLSSVPQRLLGRAGFLIFDLQVVDHLLHVRNLAGHFLGTVALGLRVDFSG